MGWNLPPIFGGTKTITGDIDWFKKTFKEKFPTTGNLASGAGSYLTGKQGVLPDWQIKGKGLAEIYAPEQYGKAGSMIREGVLSRGGAFATGLLGTGKSPTGNGNNDPLNLAGLDPRNLSKWLSDQGVKTTDRMMQPFDDAMNAAGDGYNEFVNAIKEGGALIKIPEFPAIEFPDINIPAFDLSGLAGALGQGIGGAITPDSQAIGKGIGSALGLPEDTDISPVVLIGGLGALAFIAYKVLKGGDK